jgi:hypothetical protein
MRTFRAEMQPSSFVRGSRHRIASPLGREYWSSGQMRYSGGYLVFSNAGRETLLLVFARTDSQN